MRVKRFWNWETPPDQNIESNNPDGVSVRVLRIQGTVAEESWFDLSRAGWVC